MPVKVKLYEATKGYSDKYVSRSKMAFSFLSDEDEMVGPLVDCKDYMNSRVHGSILNDAGASEYKFQPSKMSPVSMEKTRIIVVRKNLATDKDTPIELKDLVKEMDLAMDLLHPLEKDLKLKRSEYSKVTGIPPEYGQALLVEGSRRWMLASPMLSLYLFLLRNAYLHKEGQSYIETIESSPESGSKSVVAPTVKFIVKNKYVKVFGKSIEKNYPDNVDEDTMHAMGILSFGNCRYTEYWPHWLYPNQVVAVKPVKKLKEKVA